MTTVKLLAISGSLRQGSVNSAVMRAALAAPPEGVEFTTIDPRGIPFYDGDLEEAGAPGSVVELHEQMKLADGLVFFTPEYNGSYPAVTKNVIDWLSRPPKSWEGRGITMVVTTPGGRAGQSVRGHFDMVMGYFQTKHYPALGIGSYGDKITDGQLTDEATLEELRTFLADFAAHCIAEDEKD